MTQNDMRADLDYLKTMAEGGARAPSVGGRFALWWGGLAGLVLLTHWAIITGRLDLGHGALTPLWLGFLIVGGLGSAVLGRSIRGKPGLGSPGNRLSDAVWPAMGLSTSVFFFAVMGAVFTGRLDPVFFNLMLPVALLGYAIGWMSTAFMVRSWAYALPAAAALMGMAACLFALTDPAIYLIAALTVIASAAVPGAIQMLREPRTVV
ncbi:hypothetical protein ACWCOP_00705 [Maricaulaceae bacterium MS644]